MERQLEELNLLKYSLLKGEELLFIDNAYAWETLLESYPDLTSTTVAAFC